MGYLDEIRSFLGDHVVTRKEDLIPYMNDASYFTGAMPDAVLFPGNDEDVRKIMKVCNDYGVPVYVRGGGSSLTGSSIAKERGVVISMLRMNRIIEIDIDNKCVVAEPGVRLDDLEIALSKYGHFYPPDPASSLAATVGGSISTNAGGLRGVAYGVTKDWVLGLEVVTADGSLLKLGNKALKRTLGYDMVSLMIGSEGTLGIITKAILKIWPLPESTGRILAFYDRIEDAGKAINALKRDTIPQMAEFMDRKSMDSVKSSLEFPENANYTLIVDISAPPESIKRKIEEASEILKNGAISIHVTTDKEEMERIYKARKGLYASTLKIRSSENEYVVIGDIVVPVSDLPESLIQIEDASKKRNINAVFFGHIGDGNIHANIIADISKKEAMENVDGFMMDLGMIALKHGGSVSAEHGIGIEKKKLLVEEMKFNGNLETLELMKQIKHVFDPKNILNRGNIFE